ncbi:hypothetical protein [Algibacter lectus]|uniref:Uncharacterized protein n=1 Tax=Algibacter lectus TaxID=221126 RepID=A0A4R8MD94_9FLAO|nr:hypothetical protein [Algibacter lectus]MWW23919.1 hypothetical protein [Algibacter lectus]TDY63394.1 hypothetical protein DFQ06_0271 [Algibacter lectus]
MKEIFVLILTVISLNGFAQKETKVLLEKNDSKLELHEDILESKIDSLSQKVREIQEVNSHLRIQNDSIRKSTADIYKLIHSPENEIFKDFIYPIILSILAAIIFWLVFSFLPQNRRVNKVRIKIDKDFIKILNDLFALFDIILNSKFPIASGYQNKIIAGKITKEDIKIGLQNKCMNESFLYDENIKDKLDPIGRRLFGRSLNIEKTIDRINIFSDYLNTNEIILLDEIRNKLNTYDLSDYGINAMMNLNGKVVHAVNPSLSYMLDNLNDLYQSSIEIQKNVFKNKLVDRGVLMKKIKFYYFNGEYGKALSYIDNIEIRNNEVRDMLLFYKLDIALKQNSDKVLLLAEELFSYRPSLISYRNHISIYMKNKTIESIINKNYNDLELSELSDLVLKEITYREMHLKQAMELENYYNSLIKKTKMK